MIFKKLFKSEIITFSILFVLLLSSSSVANLRDENLISPKKVPTSRLVNNKELFNLLDFSYSGLEKVKLALNEGDTLRSLRFLVEYFKTRSKPRYFFSPSEVKHRANLFKKKYPIFAKQIVKEADEFIATYGTDVDWQIPGKDMYGRPHTPNTIRYLSRQAKAVNIALSYYFKNGKKAYLDFLLNHIKDFISDYENGKTESGANDVFERFYAGHRTRNWLFAHELLLGSDDYDYKDQILMLKIFLLHGARLYHACKKFHWGNHQLHGLAGLYEMSVIFPEFRIMRFWNQEAKRVIMEHVEKEIKHDGFQFERASHYFKLDLLNYFRIYKISKLNNIVLPDLFLTRFAKMFEAMVALATPIKSLPVLQDAQAIYTPQKIANGKKKLASNDVAELADPEIDLFMSLGAAIYKNPMYKFYGATQFPADLFWFFDDKIIEEYYLLKTKVPENKSVALEQTHYYVMRSGRESNDLYLLIDGGLAKYKPDHSHGGVLGVIAYAFGEEILPNYRVRYSDPSYRTMKNSWVKNVALVDNIVQGQEWISNHARTGFGIWKRLPQPTVTEWVAGENFDFFRGSHNGYDSIGVKYSRTIVFLKPFCWIVIDDFRSDQIHSYQQIWQGNYQIDDQYNRAVKTQAQARLFILQADPSRMDIVPRQNFWTNSVIFEKKGVFNYAFMTLVYPTSVQSNIEPNIRLFERPNYKQILAFAGSEKLSLYFNKTNKLSLDEIITDAEMVAVTYSNDSMVAVLVINGKTLRMKGLMLELQEKGTFEVIQRNDKKWKVCKLN